MKRTPYQMTSRAAMVDSNALYDLLSLLGYPAALAQELSNMPDGTMKEVRLVILPQKYEQTLVDVR